MVYTITLLSLSLQQLCVYLPSIAPRESPAGVVLSFFSLGLGAVPPSKLFPSFEMWKGASFSSSSVRYIHITIDGGIVFVMTYLLLTKSPPPMMHRRLMSLIHVQ